MSDVRLAHLAAQVVAPPGGKPLPFLALDHVDPGMGRLLRTASLEERVPTEAGMLEVMPGDVLFGKLRPYLAKTLGLERQSLVSAEFVAMRPVAGVESRWLAYLVLSTPFVDWAVCTSEGVKMPRTSWGRLRDFRVTAISRKHQLAIADFLDTETARIDGLIKQRTRMLILLEERWCASVDQLFADKDWSLLPLKRLLRRRPAYGVLVPRFVDSNGVRFIRGSDLDSLGDRLEGLVQIDPSQSQEYGRTVVQAGDLLLSVVGSVDKVVAVPPEAAGCNIARAVARLTPRQDVDPVVLQAAMAGSSYLRQAYEATSADTAQPTLGMGDLANFRLAWPSLASGQARLRAEIDRLSAFRRIVNSELTRQIDLLRERRQALITAAVTGQIDVTRGAT